MFLWKSFTKCFFLCCWEIQNDVCHMVKLQLYNIGVYGKIKNNKKYMYMNGHLIVKFCVGLKQGIPQQPGTGQIARLIAFSPQLLYCQKWKRQSESKIRLCFAYWFSVFASLVWFSMVYFRNQLRFPVKFCE